VNDGGYFENAHALLAELKSLTSTIKGKWPGAPDCTLKAEDDPELTAIVRKRDMLSDSVKIFTAMSIEAFINFYGVLALGEAGFTFEKIGLIPKLKKLLEIGAGVAVPPDHKILNTIERIADRRNAGGAANALHSGCSNFNFGTRERQVTHVMPTETPSRSNYRSSAGATGQQTPRV